jgi:hypothetical protein
MVKGGEREERRGGGEENDIVVLISWRTLDSRGKERLG